MKSFLILGLMPFFKVREYDVTDFDPDKIFSEYIQGVRDYGKFHLRPVGVQYENTRKISSGWTTSSPENEFVAVSAQQSLYELTIKVPDLGPEDVADCLMGARALMYDFVPEENVLIPLEEGDVPVSRLLTRKDAEQFFRRRFEATAASIDCAPLIVNKETCGAEWDERLWRIISYILGDEQVVYATLFLRAAFEHLMFYGDEFERAILRQEEKAQKIKEAVDIENSLHNCYKVVEAVYGGTLPSDWENVKRRLHSKGVDLQQEGGYVTLYGVFGKEPLLEKLKRLKEARDDRAAHGRIHANRRSTYYELMDYQVLAMRVLSSYIQHKYPEAPVLS